MKSNMIWDKVAGFMQQLRCESLSQKTMVQMPEQKKAKSELERVQIIGEEQMSHIEETERRIIREWICRSSNGCGSFRCLSIWDRSPVQA